jgi:DNA repair exonuclease SbcCD nuclease subunit
MKKYNENCDTPIAFLADTHLGAKHFHKGVFQTMMMFFEEQFFPWCIKNGVKNVIHCGDVVHNRNVIDLWINQQIKKRFFKWFEDNDINLHCLVGNHDTYYKTSIDYNYLAENTREFKRVKVYQKQEKIQIGSYQMLMVPWVINNKEFEFKEKADICCGHFDMVGFKMTGQMYSQDGFEPTQFDDFKYVFSGHYHIRSHRKNIYYVGTQYPITWNDYGEDKGFYVLDQDFEVRYYDNRVNAKFLKIYYDEMDGEQTIRVGGIKKRSLIPSSFEEAIELASKNYCRIVTNHMTDQLMFDAFYQSLQSVSRDDHKIEIVDSNEIIESFDISELEEQIQEESDLLTTVSTYLAGMTFEKDIDKDFLIGIFKELYRESSDKVIDA